MTNVDFFRAFAEFQDADPLPAGTVSVKTEEYYFEHDTELQALANLMQALNASDKQKKMFHFSDLGDPIQNKGGNTTAVKYTGEILVLIKGNPKKPVDVQRKGGGKGDKAEGRYTVNVKDLIDDGEFFRQIQEYATQQNTTALAAHEDNYYYTPRLFQFREVYGEMGFFGDGISFKYELLIQHDTT